MSPIVDRLQTGGLERLLILPLSVSEFVVSSDRVRFSSSGVVLELFHIYIYVCVCVCICIYVYMYMYVYVHICTCMYMYVYIGIIRLFLDISWPTQCLLSSTV